MAQTKKTTTEPTTAELAAELRLAREAVVALVESRHGAAQDAAKEWTDLAESAA
jgi:hypothetical protein